MSTTQTNNTIQPVLILEDGTVFYGKAFGKGTATGEICFNTGMTGYQEVFTDPSYYGQVLIMNNVHIGNYGVKEADVESDSVKVKGVIGRNLEEIFTVLWQMILCRNILKHRRLLLLMVLIHGHW